MFSTSNGGVNWTDEYNTNFQYNNTIAPINDVCYIGGRGEIYTRKLSTNINTYFDNQSTPSSIFFDSIQYPSPSSQYLRGGNSIIYSSLPYTINPNQYDEKQFYKWSDGSMDYNRTVAPFLYYYFDRSGTTIANYYKTKNLSSTPNAINNSGQSKSWRDTAGAINRIYESIGGIFFSKSYDNGSTFRKEEIVNFLYNSRDGNNNSNPSIFEARDNSYNNSRPVTHWNKNKNFVACWERNNPDNGETEIKISARDYQITSDTTFLWNRWMEGTEDRFAHFPSSSSFRSYPNIFAVCMSQENLGAPHDNYFLVVPHLRPASNGTKINVSCRFNYINANFPIDSGDISDLTVINSPNSFLEIPLHFTYRKDNKIIYRKIAFGAQGTMPIYKTNMEGPADISNGDGYQSRYKPDISLMNGFPVVSYAANYNSLAWVEYEGGETDLIQLNRYPIIKVHRRAFNDWGNYVIYNSTNVQNNPDIEGSQNTKSYIINYSAGNGLFRKVASVEAYPAYFCDPNVFAGTDSRLIKNSYTGYFGNNMSLLTLSPNNNLYKLDKQNFVISNIVQTPDNVDNLGGVVNKEAVSYSFNLGPILVKENNADVKEVTFEKDTEQTAPIVTPVEFNQNLRSNPFLLNESQALLVGCNVTYAKENSSAAVNNVQYNVNLINKSTGSLHRILYHDTIHVEDSIATEYLRGYYITNIPNGEDSFYVQISVNNNDIAEGSYNINPGYNDDAEPGDNSSGYTSKIIFENENIPASAVSIPTEYSLNQNYPNPFNPVTNLEFGIPEPGFVSLKVYDIAGKEVKTLLKEIKPAGRYAVTFDGSNLSSGIYFYRLETKKFIQTKKCH